MTVPCLVISPLFPQIHILRFSRKNACAQTHVFWCVLLKIHQQVSMGNRSCIVKHLLHVLDVAWIHLFGQVSDLRSITRVLEIDQVLSIQTDVAMF